MDPFAKFESKFKGNLKSVADPFAKFESQFNIKRGASNQRIVGGLENLNQDQLSSLGITSPVSKPTLNSVLGATSPYLTPGYKPGTLSAGQAPTQMQNLGTSKGLWDGAANLTGDLGGNLLVKGANSLQAYGIGVAREAGIPIPPELEVKNKKYLEKGILSQKALGNGKIDFLQAVKDSAAYGIDVGTYGIPFGIEGKVASMGLRQALPYILKGAALQGGLAIGSNALKDKYAGMSAGDRTKAIATDFAVSAAVVPAFYGAGKLFTKVSSLGSAANAGKNSAFFDSLIGTTSSKEANAILKNQGLVFDKSISKDVAKSLSAATNKQEVTQILIGAAKQSDNIILAQTSKEAFMAKQAAPSFVDKLPKPVADAYKRIIEAKDKFIGGGLDNFNIVEKHLKGLFDADGMKVVEKIRNFKTDVRQSTGIAAARRADNQAFKELSALAQQMEKNSKGSFSKDTIAFIQAKQNAINAKKVGGKVVAIPKGTAEQEQAYALLNRATKNDVEYLYKNGLIDKQKYDMWMNDTNYTRVQRQVEKYVGSKTFGGGEASISKSVASQKLKGSTKEAIDPIAAYIDWSNKIERNVQVNKLSTYITKKLEEVGNAKVLRDANKVAIRKEMISFLSETRPGAKLTERIVKKYSKEVKQLAAEINALNKKGLNISLKQGGKEPMGKFNVEGIANLKTRDTRQLIASLISADPKELVKLRKMLANREPKLVKLLDELTANKDILAGFKAARGEAYKTMLANKDILATGKPTLSRITDGTTEIVQVAPEIANQLKNFDKIHLGVVEDVIRKFARVKQLGATGLNIVRFPVNILNDQRFSFITSKDKFATHNIRTVFDGVLEAILKPTAQGTLNKIGLKGLAKKIGPSETYKKWISQNSHMTRIDLFKKVESATKQAYQELGLENRGALSRLESIMGSTENATRYQNFIGTYRKSLKEGYTTEQSFQRANLASRENSINFSERGEYAAFLKIANPYLPAGLQGTRTLARAFKERPVSTTASIAAIVGIPTALTTYWNLSDPERAMQYGAIPEYQKRNNIIFVLDGGRGVVMIPIDPGTVSFAQPIRNFVESEYLGDRQSLLETAKNLFVDPLIQPIGTNMNEVAANTIPGMVAPFIENLTNRKFYSGQPVIPKNLEGLAPEKQFNKNTTQLYKDAGKLFGMSPLQVENLVAGYTSTTGQQVVATTDLVRKLAGDKDISTNTKKDFLGSVLARFYTESKSAKEINSMSFMIGVAKLAKDKRIAGSELNILNSLTNRTYDENGDLAVRSDLDTGDRNRLLHDNPKLVDILAEASKDAAKKSGQNYDPLYDLTAEQRNQVLYQRAQYPGADGWNNKALKKLYWYPDFSKKENDFYNSLDLKPKEGGAPKPSDFVKEQLGRQNFDSNEVQKYLADTTAYKNNLRTQMGALTPDMFQSQNASIQMGATQAKTMGEKLVYMQNVKLAGLDTYDKFFSQNPNLDPTNKQFQGFKKSYPKKARKLGKVKKMKVTKLKKPKGLSSVLSRTTIKPYKTKSKLMKVLQ